MPIDSGLKLISDLFSGDRVFAIPPYQRPYAWDQPQVLDMLDDIRYVGGSRTHFFGTILLKDSGTQRPPLDVVEIVDGQQRLTTLQVVVAECLKRLRTSLEPAALRRLEERYIQVDGTAKLTPSAFDERFYQQFILGSQAYPNTPLTPSQNRLKTARATIRAYLERLSEAEVRNMLDQLQRMQVLVYSVGTDGEAAVIFETTNDRGKQLSLLDKTKSFLMQHLYHAVENPEERLRSVNSTFAEVYGMLDLLESNSVAAFDDESVQRWHFIETDPTWNSRKDYQDYFGFIKRRLNEIARTKEPVEVTSYVSDYCHGLLSVFSATREMIESAVAKSDAVGRALGDVFVLERTALLMPLLTAGWIRVKKADTPTSWQALSSLARACETCSFRVYGVGRKRSDAAENTLYTEAWNVCQGKSSPEDALVVVKNTTRSLVPKSTFEERLKSTTFRDDLYGIDIKYLLWKYEEHVRSQSNPVEPLSVSASEIFSDKVEIEHILPRNCGLPPERADRILNRLGNLALATKPANASMSDTPFVDKARQYYSNSSFRMQRELSSRTRWEEEEIESRTNDLVEFALKRWSAG